MHDEKTLENGSKIAEFAQEGLPHTPMSYAPLRMGYDTMSYHIFRVFLIKFLVNFISLIYNLESF